jgi:hypothetical protein
LLVFLLLSGLEILLVVFVAGKARAGLVMKCARQSLFIAQVL